jgi:Wadjet anti plasmid transformation system JetA-like protein
MSATAKRQAVLQRLLDEGSLAESACSRALVHFISPLISGSVLAWEKSGAGRRLAVRDPAPLAKFLSRQFPKDESQVRNLPPRARGVARFRDTKRIRSTGENIICVRGWRDGVLLLHGQPVPVVEATAERGLLAFLLCPDTSYEFCGRIATVENITVFTHFERLRIDAPLALYTHGRLSKQVLLWLQSQTAKGLEIVHVGDYDPVGLDEYRRLRQSCGRSVSLYLLPKLAELFQTYGNPLLLKRTRSQALLQRLRQEDDASLKTVLTYIDETNAGLEHEGLLI